MQSGKAPSPSAWCPASQDVGINFDWLLETPYYLEPVGKGEKVYALLREAMIEAGVIGIARGVMHTKAHLAALLLLASRFGRPTLGCDQLRIQG